MSGKTQYCYIKADPDHQDLKGKYIENRKEWRFEKSQEDVFEVLMIWVCFDVTVLCLSTHFVPQPSSISLYVRVMR